MNLSAIQQLVENNQFEGKLAAGGVPKSIWESYSAFANTFGGTILLGVQEDPSHHFSISPITDPNTYIDAIWNTLNNPNKISINILSNSDVKPIEVEGGYIIEIHVPKAKRSDRPVYINGNVYSGSYKRNASGDYHCTKDEVDSMIIDSRSAPSDMSVIESLTLEDLCKESYDSYRNRMDPSHPFRSLNDDQFLLRLGAAAYDESRTLRPTKAGLLFFGYEYAIVSIYRNYFLDFQVKRDRHPASGYDNRFYSSDGLWAGNLYEYYFKAVNCFRNELSKSFRLKDGIERDDDTPLLIAVREALANAVSNGDFLVNGTLGTFLYPDEIVFQNPGLLLISEEQAKLGGVPEPRNPTILKMLNIIHVGERSGSGIPRIDQCLASIGLSECKIKQQTSPDMTMITFDLRTAKASLSKTIPTVPGTEAKDVKAFLSSNDGLWTTKELATSLNISAQRGSQLARLLLEAGLIESAPGFKIGKYVTVFTDVK